MLHCFLHRWMYVSSTNGQHHPFTGKLLKREDRFCRDCDKMQTRLSQFSKETQNTLLKLTKTSKCAEWIDYKENDKVDKLTMRLLKMM